VPQNKNPHKIIIVITIARHTGKEKSTYVQVSVF
jgi:hypothetical protein